MRIKRMLAAAAVVLAMSGCSIKPADTSSGSSHTDSAEQPEIAAFPGNGAKGMEITREEYRGEYLYFLAKNGYTSDTDADTLASAQQQVINSMIEERLIRAKFAENGMTISDSDREIIQKDVDSGVAAMISSMKSALAAADSSLSDEELDEGAQAQYQQLLSTCGISEDTFYGWQETIFMKQKLTEKLGADTEVTDEELNSQLQALITAAQSQYQSSPAAYNGQNYAGIWIPEGSRAVQAILVSFDYDAYSEISSLRYEGKDEEADKLREESLGGLQERYEAIIARIVAGDDFGKLMEEFNDDQGNGTFLLTPGTEVFGKEILDCAMGIDTVGGTDTAVTDYGYYILRYESDAVVTDETLNATAEQLRGYILESKSSELFDAEMEKWKTEYSYEINDDLLEL
ncbi:MAG: hypothetical protein SPD47_08915 [Oscillospiraceae bacterium]|nr:hypothetical protein [Oscillospiraceae bacterium]